MTVSDQALFEALDKCWPAATKRLLRPAIFDPSNEQVESTLDAIAASGELRWAFPLLGLAMQSQGDLQSAILRSLGGLVEQLGLSQLTRLDEYSRPGYMWEQRIRWLRHTWDRPVGRIDRLAHEGFKAWCEARSLDAIVDTLGDCEVPMLLASMHRDGRIRQAAVRRLDGSIRAVGALLVRGSSERLGRTCTRGCRYQSASAGCTRAWRGLDPGLALGHSARGLWPCVA